MGLFFICKIGYSMSLYVNLHKNCHLAYNVTLHLKYRFLYKERVELYLWFKYNFLSPEFLCLNYA